MVLVCANVRAGTGHIDMTMTHAPMKSFREFENTEHAGYSVNHHHRARSARGDSRDIAGEWNERSPLVNLEKGVKIGSCWNEFNNEIRKYL